jgi:adenylyltransferase/sulfurtransferase
MGVYEGLNLKEHDLERYKCQIRVEEMGAEGQDRLLATKAVVIGCGALGTNAAILLARAGTGHLSLVDRDQVELSNLHRQVLYAEADIGHNKAEVAAKRIGQVNSGIQVEARVEDVTAINVEALIQRADVVIDGTDNMETRFLMNDACLKNKVPWIYGGAVATNGMSMSIVPGKTPCLRCLTKDPPGPGRLPTTDEVGVLNALTSIIGSVLAIEAIKVMIGTGPRPGLLVIDVWKGTWRTIDLKVRGDCPACQLGHYQFLDR